MLPRVPTCLAVRWMYRSCSVGLLAAACHAGPPALPSGGEARPGPSQPSAEPTPSDPSYLVVYRPGPRWPPGDAMPPELRDHFRYLLSLHRAGALQLAGPFAGQVGGAALLRAHDDAAARALLEADPAVSAQVFEVDLQRWSLVDWAAHGASPAK